MSARPEPILPNGEINDAWTTLYMAEHQCEYKAAHAKRQEAIIAMDPPSLRNGRGGVNPVWVTWYKFRKRVSTNIAKNIAKLYIQKGEFNPDINADIHRIRDW